MRDPVADVLVERAATGRGLAGAVALSLVLHAAGGAFAVYTAMRRPAPAPVSTLNIRLTSPRSAPVKTAAKPAAPRIEEPAPQPPAPPQKKTAEPPTKNSVPLSAFGKSPKKGADVPAPAPSSAPSLPAASATGPAGIGEAALTGLEGGDFPYTMYLDRMKVLVGSRWARPQSATGVPTVVYFRIERNGTIRDSTISTPSGNSHFDRAALRAVLEASPLPPLPPGYSGSYLGVHLTFR